jgi:hypothetical protein
MAKSFKKFREDWDDEWGNDDHEKDRKLRERRDNRRKKTNEKFSRFEDRDEE